MKNRSVGKSSSSSHPQFEKKKREAPVPLPDVTHMDDIAISNDDTLLDHLRRLEVDRDRVLEAKYDPRVWEVEACYIRRELQLRRERHHAHGLYLDVLQREAEEAQRMENRYPVADLDNSEFMFWERS